jgi:glycosyltransferase involved in cell wall biosynthesis
MKLLNIIQCTNLAGMERASLRLMQSMGKKGHEFELVSLHPLGGLAGELEAAGIPAIGLRYGGPMGISVIPQLVKLFRTRRWDGVVMTGPHLCAMVAMRLAGRRGAFLAVHFHHRGVKSDGAWRLIYRLALSCFKWITFPSDFVREEACENLPAVRGRSMTIRYPQEVPVEPSEAEKMAARERMGLREGDFVVGNAGWLIPRKRFDVFLRVAAGVSAVRPEARFVIAGGGAEEAGLRELADELGTGGRVKWLGWQSDLSDFYAVLDAMVFNADRDTLPVTPQEAVAHGVPLVASLVHGGLREIFDDRLAGRILGEHDIEALVGQVVSIAADPAGARAAADVSRAHYRAISDPGVIAEQHEKLLIKR